MTLLVFLGQIVPLRRRETVLVNPVVSTGKPVTATHERRLNVETQSGWYRGANPFVPV